MMMLKQQAICSARTGDSVILMPGAMTHVHNGKAHEVNNNSFVAAACQECWQKQRWSPFFLRELFLLIL